jgi:hypothetical protein
MSTPDARATATLTRQRRAETQSRASQALVAEEVGPPREVLGLAALELLTVPLPVVRVPGAAAYGDCADVSLGRARAPGLGRRIDPEDEARTRVYGDPSGGVAALGRLGIRLLGRPLTLRRFAHIVLLRLFRPVVQAVSREDRTTEQREPRTAGCELTAEGAPEEDAKRSEDLAGGEHDRTSGRSRAGR